MIDTAEAVEQLGIVMVGVDPFEPAGVFVRDADRDGVLDRDEGFEEKVGDAGVGEEESWHTRHIIFLYIFLFLAKKLERWINGWRLKVTKSGGKGLGRVLTSIADDVFLRSVPRQRCLRISRAIRIPVETFGSHIVGVR